MFKILSALAMAAVLILLACTAAPTTTDTSKQTFSSDQVIIDVRTPEEYAAGHLEGAINIDYRAGNFADEIGKLDKSASYVLYCRTGKRAGDALEVMQSMGFADVTNAKGYNDASKSTGLEIVK